MEVNDNYYHESGNKGFFLMLYKHFENLLKNLVLLFYLLLYYKNH